MRASSSMPGTDDGWIGGWYVLILRVNVPKEIE